MLREWENPVSGKLWETEGKVGKYTMSDVKTIPELYIDKAECCGCSACFAICPQKAIEMREYEQGFLYPFIIPEKCIGCQLCRKVCPIK